MTPGYAHATWERCDSRGSAETAITAQHISFAVAEVRRKAIGEEGWLVS